MDNNYNDSFDNELANIIEKQRQLQIDKNKLVDSYFRRIGLTLATKMGYPVRGEFVEGKIDFDVLMDVVEKGSEWYKTQYPDYKSGYEERKKQLASKRRKRSQKERSLRDVR
ncbi:hypothetical protein AALT52_01210 [Ligilactobacillus faecis]|uniref:Pathogenicity island protein n=1 Tax=Ligilactobacillus faecis TaxID=762833 RepID=A0ABV4DP35_9LACO